MSTPATIYDRDVDRSASGLVRAPFRVRSELHAAPRPGKPWAAPVPCTSDNVVLGDFDGSFAVVQPVSEVRP